MMLRVAWLLLAVLAGAGLAWVFTRFLKNWAIARRLAIVTALVLFGWAIVELVTTSRGELPTIVLLTMGLATGTLRRSGGSSGGRTPNKRLKLTARVDCGMNLFSARRSLSAIR
jgi:hypothetical protein